MKKKTQKSVASFDSRGAVAIGASDVIRWDDVMTINGTDIKISKVVELGIRHDVEIAKKLEEDLKSETGLLVTFPMGILMDKLQRIVGSGTKLLALVKP